MSIIYVLFNPTAGSGRFLNDRNAIQQFFQNDELNYFDITKIKDYDLFFRNIRTDVKLLLLGGDGTINRFVNDTDKVSFINDVYYYPTGTGNDFYNDVALIETASVGAAPANAPEDVKECANVIVADNEHSAVADFIGRYLFEHK